ncbi:hypothetical protein [Agrococcus sp. ProA11]|uniref:hypothetical protein n=1 Tax=Agrococcus chionoecetis TaxID=3153752 RepID=UPI003261CD83
MDEEHAQIAGYRLVRELRRDAERMVWVAASASETETGGAVEIHRSLGGADGVLAGEAEALLAADHPHIVPILDVATDEGVVLVRPLLPRSLAEWLVRRQAPSPGEAVTALAPIAAALAALHRRGACAGGCAAQAVRLDADGAPLLLGEGAHIETDRPTDAWREASTGVADDAEGWRLLAVAVLEAGGAAVPAAVDRALAQRDLAAAADAMLAAWPALPLAPEDAPSSIASPAPAPMRRRDRADGPAAIWARIALLLEVLVDRGGPSAARLARSLAAVRPRFWAIAAVGAAMLLLAGAALWPATPTGADELATGEVVPSPSAVDAAALATATADAAEDPAVFGGQTGDGEDPLTAVAALLAEREACLDAGDAACLVGLHAPDSPQLVAAVPWRMPEDGRLEPVQRLGDAWLLRVVSEREPASVLAMSTEAGWVLRDAWSD